MMDLMCPLWMMLRASGLSIKMQCRTSRMPTRPQIHQLVKTRRRERHTRGHSSKRHPVHIDQQGTLSVAFHIFIKEEVPIIFKQTVSSFLHLLRLMSLLRRARLPLRELDSSVMSLRQRKCISQWCFTGGSVCVRIIIMSIPEEDSSLSSLLTSQSKLLENWVQLFLFPLINAATGHKERCA